MNVQEEINIARKLQDKTRLLVIQDLSTRVLLESKKLKRELTATEMHTILTKMASIRVEARDVFRAAGSNENATKEQAELEWINAYNLEYAALMPKQMSTADIEFALCKILDRIEVVNIGNMMKAFRADYPGQDGALVKSIVERMLKR